MRLPKDILNAGLYTKPNFFLCQTDKEKICKLETTETKGMFKFNSLSEISFEASRVYNDVITGESRINPYYDLIEALRLIYVDGFGYFELQGPQLVSDGIAEKKSCTAYSLEYTLAQKYLENFYVNMGTVESIEVINAASDKNIVPITLYNPTNPKLSLLHLVLEEVYGWKIGYVDASLQTLSRQFEVDRESVYDFLMNDVCEKFNCYIVFDTISNTINVYAESLTAKFIGDGRANMFTISPPFAQIGTVSVDGYKTTRWTYNATTGALTLENAPESGAHIEVVDGALVAWETDVFVSFENLAQEVNIEYNADDIKTRLTVTYGDDYDIRETNLGLPYLTDISYYYTVDWMGKDLYDAYTKYMQKSNDSQAEYTKNSQEILRINDHISYEENRLSLEYSLVESVNATTVGTYYTRQKNLDGSYYYSEVSLPSEYVVDVDYYSNVTTNVNEEKVGDLYSALQKYFYAYFNGKTDDMTAALDELNELLGFEFMETYTLTYLFNSLKSAKSIGEMDTAIYNFLGELWVELGRTPLKELYLAPYKTAQETNIEAGWSNKDNDNYGNYYPVVLFINSIEAAIAKRDKTISDYRDQQSVFQKANAAISDSLLMRNNFTEAQLIRLSAFLREDELHIDDIVETGLDDLSSSFKIKQDAMESGRIELQKISQPQLQFSMTMANIYALPEFEPIINQFQLGKVIRVCLRQDYIKQSRLLQVDINFDDFSDFSCEFGELTSLRTQSDIHADLLGQAISAGKSVATNSSYWTRGSDQATALDLKIQQGLLDATTQIKAIDGNQGVVIDKYGIKLQKKMGNGEIDPHQTWLVNNMILMSDDGFKTSRSALGEITVDGQRYYGLIAEAVLSGYIEGTRIVGGEIKSNNYVPGESGTHFNLTDGDFDIAGGKIIYDTAKDSLTMNNITIDWASTNYPSVENIDGLDEYLDHIEDLDGRIQTYNQTIDPSESWADDEYDAHIGDLWINADDGVTRSWNGESWAIVTDGYLEELAKSKAQIFTETPTTPYYVGDLWVQGFSGDILHCISTKTEGQSYDVNDWAVSSKYTDDTKANSAYTLADSAKGVADNAKEIGQKLVSGLGFEETEITGKYVISPVIAGGTLLIGDKSGTHAQITTEGQLICTGANISGDIMATSLTLGSDASINANKVDGLSKVATTGSYSDLDNKPTIPTSISDLTDGADILYADDVSISAATTSNGVTKQTIKVGDNTYTSITAGDFVLTNVGLGADTANGSKSYTCISKDGLLTAKNAIIYGTVYATSGRFSGDITATSLTLGNGVSISANNVDGLSDVATSGSYDDLDNKPTIPTSVSDLGLDASTILYRGDITQSKKKDSDGIEYLETTVPSSNGNIVYSTYNTDDYIVFGREKGTNVDGSNYVCVSKDGLLTARNALIYGTVYATAGQFSGSINVNNKFLVDDEGNATIQSGVKFLVNSGGTVQISAGSGEGSFINLGEAFAASSNGVSATSGNFGSLMVGGQKVLTEESLGSKIVVSATEPNQTGIIWICPTSVQRVEYQGFTDDNRVYDISCISNKTRNFNVSCMSSDTLPNSVYKYTIKFPIILVFDGSKETNVVFSVTATKSNDPSKIVRFSDYTLSSINEWETKVIEMTVESSTNLCGDTGDIGIAISANGCKANNTLYIDKDKYINFTAADTNATGSTQPCSVYYKP